MILKHPSRGDAPVGINSKWSFAQGLIGLSNSLSNGSEVIHLPEIEEGDESNSCHSFTLGDKALKLGQHGWDLDYRDERIVLLTDSPQTANMRQRNSLEFFLREILGISKIDLMKISLRPVTGEQEVERSAKIAGFLGASAEKVETLLSSLNEYNADFLNPFNEDEREEWYRLHRTSVNGSPASNQPKPKRELDRYSKSIKNPSQLAQ